MGVRMSAFCGQATSLFCLFKARLANFCFFAYIFSVKGESQEQSEHVDCVANTCTAQQGKKREVEVDQGKKMNPNLLMEPKATTNRGSRVVSVTHRVGGAVRAGAQFGSYYVGV